MEFHIRKKMSYFKRKTEIVFINLLLLCILNSCALIQNNQIDDRATVAKANAQSKLITIKWRSDKKDILGYKIYHGQNSGNYQRPCIKGINSPIEITAPEIISLNEPSYQIPINQIEEECFFSVSAFNSSGESPATPEIHFIKQK